MRGTQCSNCTEPASGHHSLPVDNNADFIANTAPVTEWGAVPCCENCYNLHAAGGVNGPAVLDAFSTATSDLRDSLEAARAFLSKLSREIDDVLGQL